MIYGIRELEQAAVCVRERNRSFQTFRGGLSQSEASVSYDDLQCWPSEP